MSAIYNEIDPFAVRWLRNLIGAGHIAPGVVDERSISDLVPADVAGLGQRHFFAGIAGWSLALRLAGLPDNANVWTGSCPCQGLSSAGKRLGFDDPRHLWPAWFRLIRECRPAVVFGEQVASSLGWAWLDLVFADLEGAGYACAAADLPACGVGAPHRRQRLFFVAYADGEQGRLLAAQRQSRRADAQAVGGSEAVELADTASTGRQERRHPRGGDGSGSINDGPSCGLADSDGERRHGVSRDAWSRRKQPESTRGGEAIGMANAKAAGRGSRRIDSPHGRSAIEPHRYGNDSWTPCDWLPCSDGVSRPVEPGTRPLAHGVPGRVGLLRGYGNAIVPQVAAEFVCAALEAA